MGAGVDVGMLCITLEGSGEDNGCSDDDDNDNDVDEMPDGECDASLALRLCGDGEVAEDGDGLHVGVLLPAGSGLL